MFAMAKVTSLILILNAGIIWYFREESQSVKPGFLIEASCYTITQHVWDFPTQWKWKLEGFFVVFLFFGGGLLFVCFLIGD